ncbi:hypothetical protein NON20_19970 [Synechocystis sp. B12]|nr:hypothetical protein NON20_19970 [Synechocystis sp. B12]
MQPLTKSESSGAVKTVIGALDPCLNRLLALKWLTLLANGNSTQLGPASNWCNKPAAIIPCPA